MPTKKANTALEIWNAYRAGRISAEQDILVITGHE